MSVSEHPTRMERLLNRLPSRRARGAAEEADGLRHLVDMLSPGPDQPAPASGRAGARPYGTGRTA
ncbi:hypothetical protein [Streptosporangium sp. V21-05]|uniref:hypothetical protein n=1 Tax=Streptosporangium sp. V21-05 TaxID=3446115 RepID=UPI003F52B49D